jgi:hypothetical protein
MVFALVDELGWLAQLAKQVVTMTANTSLAAPGTVPAAVKLAASSVGVVIVTFSVRNCL